MRDDEVTEGLAGLIEDGAFSPAVMTVVTVLAGTVLAAYGRHAGNDAASIAGACFVVAALMSGVGWLRRRGGDRHAVIGALGAFVGGSLAVVMSTLFAIAAQGDLPWGLRVAVACLASWHAVSALRIAVAVRSAIAKIR